MPADADTTGSPRVGAEHGPVDPTPPLVSGPPMADADASPAAGLFTDPNPTAQIPAIDGEPPASGGDGQSDTRRRMLWAAALFVPVLLFFLGVSLVVAGIGFDWSSNDPATPSARPNGGTIGLPVATAAAAVAGDPALAATDTVATFVALLQARRFAEATAMADGVYDESAITVSYGSLPALEAVVVRIAPVGPDEYRIRVVLWSTPADTSTEVTARCEQWSVNPAARRVIPGKNAAPIGGRDTLLLRGADLTAALTQICVTAPLP